MYKKPHQAADNDIRDELVLSVGFGNKYNVKVIAAKIKMRKRLKCLKMF